MDLRRLPFCFAQYEANHRVCDGEPGALAYSERLACEHRDACSAIQLRCAEKGRHVSAYVRFTADDNQIPYAVPHNHDRLVEISTKNVARYGIKNGRPTQQPTARGAIRKSAPALDLLSARQEKQAVQDRRGAAYLAQDEWYVEWLGAMCDGLGKTFASKGTAKVGQLYVVDRRRLSAYVVLTLKTRAGGVPLARLEWRPAWDAMNVCYPVDIRAWGSMPRDLIAGLAPQPYNDHRWKTRSQRLARKAVMDTPRAIGFLLRNKAIAGT